MQIKQDEIDAILKSAVSEAGVKAKSTEDAKPGEDYGEGKIPRPPEEDAGGEITKNGLHPASQSVEEDSSQVGAALIRQEQTGTSRSTSETYPVGAASERDNITLLLDIPLNVSVELGRTKITIKDMLQLGPGSVIELDKLVGEPVDLIVNDMLIARGEVVVFDENFGVRITDIVNPEDRIRSLR